MKIDEHQPGRQRKLLGERCAVGPEEVDAVQEADEQGWVAERRQRAAHVGDEGY